MFWKTIEGWASTGIHKLLCDSTTSIIFADVITGRGSTLRVVALSDDDPSAPILLEVRGRPQTSGVCFEALSISVYSPISNFIGLPRLSHPTGHRFSDRRPPVSSGITWRLHSGSSEGRQLPGHLEARPLRPRPPQLHWCAFLLFYHLDSAEQSPRGRTFPGRA